MSLDTLRDNLKGVGFFVPHICSAITRRVAAYGHSWTWRDTPDAKSVVVVGGSFAGIELVKRLAETLPTGYKVVWIEKNSHLNYSFNFPRYSVLKGHEHKAFIPYDGVAKGAPTGIFTRIQDKVVSVTENQVLLESGESIDYAYLAIATGSSQPLPVQVASTERDDACYELQDIQRIIEASHKIAIVGGGAVGIELASDIKDFFPEKEVTLMHSRDRLMNQFGNRLGDYVLTALRDELKIRVMLCERPKIPDAFARNSILAFSDGHKEQFDLIIGCTGQRPNSSILAGIYSNTVSKENSRILVRPTLQAFDSSDPQKDLPIFAFGDVADHPGPHMARAGWRQAEVVADNILAKIQERMPSHEYVPNLFVEGVIKLTLGKKHQVIYATNNDGSDIIMPAKNDNLDLQAEAAWRQYGADFKRANEATIQHKGKAVKVAHIRCS